MGFSLVMCPIFLLHRKSRDPYAAVLLCFVTDMDQIGGRRGAVCACFLFVFGYRSLYTIIVLCCKYAVFGNIYLTDGGYGNAVSVFVSEEKV